MCFFPMCVSRSLYSLCHASLCGFCPHTLTPNVTVAPFSVENVWTYICKLPVDLFLQNGSAGSSLCVRWSHLPITLQQDGPLLSLTFRQTHTRRFLCQCFGVHGTAANIHSSFCTEGIKPLTLLRTHTAGISLCPPNRKQQWILINSN